MSLLRLRTDPACDELPAPLEDFLRDPALGAVSLEAGDDARALLPLLDQLLLVAVRFPSFRDGRGFSAARILREAGYAGELRATGDILLDQVVLLRRAGIDAFAARSPLDPSAVQAALARFPAVYQRSVDARAPVWALRHG